MVQNVCIVNLFSDCLLCNIYLKDQGCTLSNCLFCFYCYSLGQNVKSHTCLEAYDFGSLEVYIPGIPCSDCKTDGDLKAWLSTTYVAKGGHYIVRICVI
jgi:hypothetical protein